MLRKTFKKIALNLGLDLIATSEKISKYSIQLALRENNLGALVRRLRKIVPDISNQDSGKACGFNDYWELKRRALQAFQCELMLEAVKGLDSGKLTVVDIGDSAGTHMLYLKELAKDNHSIETISVNLDPRAIKKIEDRGLKAILCRAEELNFGASQIDLFTSFEMVEHLHNPAIFFRRLAKRNSCNRLAITVPYLKQSRVGLRHIRSNSNEATYAENEHIFELNLKDWSILMRHSGWKVVYSRVYYQYPRNWPIFTRLLASYWKKTDYEGFWGAILEKDTTLSDLYQDWENEEKDKRR